MIYDSESDARFCYCACVVCHIIGGWSAIDVNRLVQFIFACRNYDGGFGQKPGLESHAGSTYCCLASLELLKFGGYFKIFEEKYLALKDSTIRWLTRLHNQDGGFCGRTHKDSDTCYCFWANASLMLLNKGFLRSHKNIEKFLMETENKPRGGFSKFVGMKFAGSVKF